MIPEAGTMAFEPESLLADKRLLQALDEQARLLQQGELKSLSQICVDFGLVPAEGLEAGLSSLRAFCLSRAEIFSELTADQLGRVADIASQLLLAPNTTIIRQNDPGDSLCLIVSGRVEVVCRTEQGAEVPVNILEAGDSFGEMALLTGEPRSASVRTLEAVSLLLIAKNDFDTLLQAQPSLSQAFLRILTRRLAENTRHLAESFDQEQAIQRLLLDNQNVRHREVIGRSWVVRRLKRELAAQAEDPGPLLITGEEGTEKGAAGFEVHQKLDPDNERPFVRLDVRSLVLPKLRADGSRQDPLYREMAQKSALFGHVKGAFSFAATRRMGSLQIADQGTLLLENIEFLEENVQTELLSFLDSGTFTPLGGRSPTAVSVRLLATVAGDPQSLAAEGRLQPELAARFGHRVVEVPPLRTRKRDLRLLIDSLLEHSVELFGKEVQGISREAYQRLLAYDWPGNFDELEASLKRAISLAEQAEIGADEVLLGPSPVSGRFSYDLLRMPAVRSLLTHRLYPWLGQAAAGAFLLLIVVGGLLGQTGAWGTLSTKLTWGVWEPLIVLGTFFAARQWCAVCPIGGAVGFLSRSRFNLNRKVPHFLRQYGFWLSLAGLAAIIWSELVWDMVRSPVATAVLIISIAAAGLATSLIFQRQAWCRYLCPLGRWLGVLSTCSCVEMRANQSLCLNECQEHRCYRDSQGRPVCPVYETPFSQHFNLDCLLCSACLKACPHSSPRLNLRIPGYELLAAIGPSQVIVGFLPVLAGTQLARALARSGSPSVWISWGPGWLVWLAVIFLASLASLAYLRLAARLVFPSPVSSGWKPHQLLSHGLVPLALSAEAALHWPNLWAGLAPLVSAAAQWIGWSELAPGLSAGHGSAGFLQGLFIAAGTIWSLLLIRALRCKHASARGMGWLRLVPVILPALVFLQLLG